VTLRLAVAAAFGVATVAFAADDPNAPLANTKAQLQSLKKDAAAQQADTPRAPKLELPSIQGAVAGPELELPRPKRDDADSQDRKRAQQKDWLLQGFDRLDRKSSFGTAKSADTKAETEDEPLDPNDPDYFLRVYERQRAERDTKRLDVNALASGELRTDAPDPLAPFMKEWLADSPVREALQSVNATHSTGDRVASGSIGSAPMAVTHTASAATVSARPVPNPFVQALGLPTFDQTASDTRAAAVEPVRNTPTSSPTNQTNTIYDLPERPKTDVRQALPAPPADDKKYFPQLKKF
jgi:hypothetical protein